LVGKVLSKLLSSGENDQRMTVERFSQCDVPPSATTSLANAEEFALNTNAPIDAVVYDVHPALTFPPDYPYAPRPPGSSSLIAAQKQRPAPGIQRWLTSWLGFQAPGRPQYYVPQRFGMSAIFGIMTALALLFGGLHSLDAAAVVYLFFGLQAVVICLAQMFSSNWPRLASSIAGAVLAPLFAVELLEAADIHLHAYGWERVFIAVVLAIPAVPIGAFLGYLTGTCAAGVFLVMELLENHFSSRRAVGE
jgi:hypothetical protein